MSRILLIDDDADMLKLTERWFLKAGYDTDTATSGEAAIELMKSVIPDVILLDYAMPVMDGPATLRAIRANERTKEIPVLFRTGKDDLSSSEEMEALNPAGVVSKAEGKPVLLKAVENVLNGI